MELIGKLQKTILRVLGEEVEFHKLPSDPISLIFYNMEINNIHFDVMLNGRYQATLSMPILGGVISQKQLMTFVEEKKPQLKGKNYNIKF